MSDLASRWWARVSLEGFFRGASMRLRSKRAQAALVGFAVGTAFAATWFSLTWPGRVVALEERVSALDLPARDATNRRVLDAYALLRSTPTGRELLDEVQGDDVEVEVGRVESSTLAWHISGLDGRRIRVGEHLIDAKVSVEFLAGVLAHEFTHARQAQFRLGQHNAHHELEAFVNEVLVWKQAGLAPGGPDWDRAWRRVEAFDRGRDSLEREVDRLYPSLAWLPERRVNEGGGYYARLEDRLRRVWSGAGPEPALERQLGVREPGT